MPTKFLNIIIVVSILGIIILSIKDVFFPEKETEATQKTAVSEMPLPSLTPTVSPIPPVACASTMLGDIKFKTLTYQLKTKNDIALNLSESTPEASVVSEQLILNLLDKTESNIRYTLGKNSADLILTCSTIGVHAEIFGNQLMILNNTDLEEGDTWTSPAIVQSPVGFGDTINELDFEYSVVDVTTKNMYGESRTEVTVEVYLDTLKAMQYKILSGVGLENLKIDLDLEQLGTYSKEITLQSAR